MTTRRWGPSTTAIHGVPHRRADWTPVAPALVQSSTFANPIGSDEEVLYSRYGNNPNQLALAKKYALLEGAEDAIFLASGMGATALAHLAVLRPGDHLVTSAWIYGGTQRNYDVFAQCRDCGRAYWKGAHHEQLVAIVERALTEFAG